jgi:hypothetical protein
MYQTARTPGEVQAWVALGYTVRAYGQDAKGLFVRLFLKLR